MGLLAVLLTVLFVALKLTSVVAWCWFAVVSPLVAYVAFLLVVLIVAIWAHS